MRRREGEADAKDARVQSIESGAFQKHHHRTRGWTWEEGLDSLERVAAHDAVALELGVDVEAPDVGHGVSHATEPSRPCVVVNERRRFKRAPGCRFLGAII